MSAILLDGKSLAGKSEAELLQRVDALKGKSGGKTPILATIPVSYTHLRAHET